MANEGSTKPTYEELEAELADAEKECAYWMKKAGDAERVRGLLQQIRMATVMGPPNETHGEQLKRILALTDLGAESADIGKLDTADKSGKVNRVDESWPNVHLGSMYEHPVPSEPFPLPGSAETGGEKADD